MSRLGGPRLVAPSVVVAALVLTACGSAQDVVSAPDGATRSTPTSPTPPTTPTTPTPITPSESTPTKPAKPEPQLAGRPQVGNCFAIGRQAFARQRDGSFAVPCSKRHTAETFAVFSVSSSPSASEIDKAWRSCQPRFTSYVGGSPTISTLGLAVMLPSEAQAAAGQGWIRCDAIQQPSYNGNRGITRSGSVRGVLAGSVPPQFRGCALHWPKVDQPVLFTTCKRSHQAELIPASLNLGGPEAPFPGVSASKSRSQLFCESTFQDYVSETLNYYFYYPTAASWKSGSHDTTCWALDTRGDGLPPI